MCLRYWRILAQPFHFLFNVRFAPVCFLLNFLQNFVVMLSRLKCLCYFNQALYMQCKLCYEPVLMMALARILTQNTGFVLDQMTIFHLN